MVPDNYDLWEAHDAAQNRRLKELPICYDCGERIQDDHCYEYNGEYICPQCNEDLHRKDLTDYIGEDC